MRHQPPCRPATLPLCRKACTVTSPNLLRPLPGGRCLPAFTRRRAITRIFFRRLRACLGLTSRGLTSGGLTSGGRATAILRSSRSGHGAPPAQSLSHPRPYGSAFFGHAHRGKAQGNNQQGKCCQHQGQGLNSQGKGSHNGKGNQRPLARKQTALSTGGAYLNKKALPGFPWVADLLMSFPEGTNEGYGPIFSDSRADRALVC